MLVKLNLTSKFRPNYQEDHKTNGLNYCPNIRQMKGPLLTAWLKMAKFLTTLSIMLKS